MQMQQPAEGFAAIATFLGTPLPENPIAALRQLRREAAAEIERLLDFLDALGGDPDLEDSADDEPSLGWGKAGGVDAGGGDLELDDCDSEDNGDREPSLGSVDNAVNQSSWWSRGNRRDLEDEHDGREPNGDEQDFSVAEWVRLWRRNT